MRGNTITIELPLKRGKVSKTIPLYQYDYGQKLIITDVELPSYYEVHFSNEMHGDAVTSIGDSTGVEIPDSLLATGENVYLWLYLHDSDSDGETEFQGAIPVIRRARVTDQTPTPHERTIIEQAVSALNSAVSDVAGKVEDAEAAQIAAEAAQAAAETAQSKAEDAQEAAETAQDAAEDAQTAAETAQGKAEDAQGAAETAQGKAEDAQGAAESAQSAAEGFAGNASDSADDAEAWAVGTEDSTHPAHGNSAKDWAEEAAEVVQGIIDDTAGDGDTDKTWSADKMHDQFALKADKWDPTIYGKISHGRKGGSTAGTNSAVIGGDNAVASGSHAVAEGQFTIAAGAYQRASGKFNVADSNGTYAEIIGNGYAEIDPQTFVVTEHRSNARTLDWNGNETLAGDLTVNKGKTNEMNLVSEVYNLKNEIDDKYEKPSSGIPKTDLANAVQTTLNNSNDTMSALKDCEVIKNKDFIQKSDSRYNGFIVEKGLYKITAYGRTCSVVVSPPFVFDTSNKVEIASNIINSSVYYNVTRDYHSIRIWQSGSSTDPAKVATVKKLGPLTIIDEIVESTTDFDVLLEQGHTYHFFGSGSNNTFKVYDINGNSTELFSAKSMSHAVFTADKQYVRVQAWKNSSSSTRPLAVLMYDEAYAPTEVNRSIEWASGDINGSGGITTGSTAVSTPVNGSGLYIVTFPNTLKVKVNMVDRESGGRTNRTFTTPFSFFDNNAVIACYEADDGDNVSASDSRLADVHIYCVPKKKGSRFDVTIAASNSYENDQNSADIVCGGTDDAPILSAVFGCWDSVNVLMLGGDYYVNSLYTMTDGSKCAITIRDENPYPSESGMFRRYLTVEGDSMCVPPAEKPVNIRVTEDLHETLDDSATDQYIIGFPYAEETTIAKSYTAVVLKNFNVIGWYYDKPVTYIDLSRALNIIIESVNVRSWGTVLAPYTRMEQVPHEECVGLRVGIGNQYGVQNSISHSNYWYLGKAVVCNGEHFVITDVKTHHDYIGFVFGDRETNGYMQHPLILIGCSIENCYRLMLFTKNGITTEQEWQPSSGLGSKSTFICIGLSTENHWDTPGGEGYVLTLPCLEVIKNVYRGRFECDFNQRPFETGSGSKIACTWYDGDGAHHDA